MRTRELQTLLTRIVLGTLPAYALAACGSDDDCYQTIVSTYDVDITPDGGADAGVDDGGASNDAGVPVDCAPFCPTASACTLHRLSDRTLVRCSATIQRECPPKGVVEGRRPAGLVPERQRRADLGGLLATMAHLEGASIVAFAVLEKDLRAHGAPRRLLDAASRARQDEIRHHRTMTNLARRYGAKPDRPRVEPRPRRTLEAVAIENEVEGCVRETYGALVASWQSRMARDPAVRTIMRSIATDEMRHAALAWQISDWARRELGARGRARLDSARRRAVATLRREVRAEAPKDAVVVAGMPDRASAELLLGRAERALFRR